MIPTRSAAELAEIAHRHRDTWGLLGWLFRVRRGCYWCGVTRCQISQHALTELARIR